MVEVLLVNKSNGNNIAGQVELAHSFTRRLRGLMGKKKFPAGSALVLEPCKQIHTFLMRFPIDVLFLDGRGQVLHTMACLPPGRVSPYVRKAASVVELPAGTISAAGIAAGHLMQIVKQEGSV